MKYVIIIFNLCLLISCTRTASNNSKSTLKFDFSKVQYKNSVLASSFPEATEICYGVNVTAQDIPSRSLSCGPTLGLTAGFVPSGSEVSLDVPSGENRNVDLYMYLPKTGQGCPSTESSKIDTTNLFKVSSKSNVALNSTEVILEMPVAFPGYDHSVFDDMNLPSSCMEGQTPNNPPAVNPNAPKIIATTLSNNSFTSVGVDEFLTLTILTKATYSVNWLNINHYGPNGNISGSGNGQMFYSCSASHTTNPAHICYGYDNTYYFAVKTFTVSQWVPNGNYFIDFNVQDTMYFNSENTKLSYSVANHPNATPPAISNLIITPDSTLASGTGGSVYVSIAVSSVAPPNYIFKSLIRPDTTPIYGGGSMTSFSTCAGFTSNASHVCFGLTSAEWFTTFYDFFSMFAQNGTYNYTGIQVQNAALLNSSVFPSTVSFTISGNTPAWTPSIYSTETYYAFDDSSLTYGIPYYNGSCVLASQGSNLSLGFKSYATTNAPLNFIYYNLTDPNGVIAGGGNGIGSTNIGTNQYRVDYENSIANIGSKARGNYSWSSISVANEGGTPSNLVGPFSLAVQDSCLTFYSPIITSKANSTCAITSTNNIKCWGSNALNIIDHGYSGNPRKYPTLILGNNHFVDVAIGNSHTCAIDSTNHLFCWGDNIYGQLGNGTTTGSAYPIAIDSGTQYSRISVGITHTCGITFSGSLKCWGQNTNGQLGDGTTVQKTTPTLIDSGVTYFNVKLGNQHSCGLTNTGVLKCWGYNNFGQLGDGTTTQRLTPTVIDIGTSYMILATGAVNTCGTTSSSQLKCWGNNGSGQIGDGTTTQRSSPTLIDAGSTYLQINIGSSHTCGITTSNILKCWGNNSYGQLGNGSFTNSSTPITIDSFYSQVTAGISHTCAVKNDGRLFCWGNNTYGQLGNGSATASPTPVAIDQ